MQCTKCGTKMFGNGALCSNCEQAAKNDWGFALNAPTNLPPARKPNQTWLLFLSAVAITIVVAVVLIIAIPGRTTNLPSPYVAQTTYEEAVDAPYSPESPAENPIPLEPEIVEPTPPPIAAAIFPFEFEAEDLYGNTVTHESLGERELFLLYFWTTWCAVCITAMPGMAELAAEFYDRMGFVSLLGDFESGRDAAILMTENANAPFFSVDIMLEDFVPLIPFIDSGFVPTTALIDTQGNMIGEMIMGSDIDGLRSRINAALGN